MEEKEEIPWYLDMEYRKGSVGFMVETASGFIGRTYHEKGMVNGKMPVYTDNNNMPMICNPKTLLFVGKIKSEDDYGV